MLIASFCLGDTLLTLVKVQSLDSKDELQESFSLTCKDIATDKSFTKVYAGENEAILSFAAILASDDADFKEMAKALADLRDSPMYKFLP